MRIGLLGGSFDPVHVAHIALARAAIRELQLDEVQLIPAANPWQRAPLQASPEHRVAMIEAAIADETGMRVNTIEIDRGGETYTLDTIEALPQGPRYTWLLGTDQLRNFCTWRGWRQIAELVDLAVAARPGSPLSTPRELQQWLDTLGRKVSTLPFTPMPVSASAIRTCLAQGKPANGMIAPSVAHYIAHHGLYQDVTSS